MARKTTTLLAALVALTATPAIAQSTSRELPPPPQTPVKVKTEPACETTHVTVYFAAYETMLSRYSQRAITNARDTLKHCAINGIKAVAISEEAHTDEAMADLSTDRAVAVVEALAATGIDSPNTECRVTPITVAATDHPNSILSRRVDVTVYASASHGL